MTFVLLDDQFHSNPKVIAMGLDGAGLYARALSYCGDYETDGFVPLSFVRACVGMRRKLPRTLVDVGAWVEAEPGDELVITEQSGSQLVVTIEVRGYVVLDYCRYNRSSRELNNLRKEKSKAGKKGALKRWGDSSSHSKPVAPAMASANSSGQGKTIARARAALTPKDSKSLTEANYAGPDDDDIDWQPLTNEVNEIIETARQAERQGP